MESLAQNHAFVDGNKRTAVTAAALFLKRNGRTLQTTSTELEQFTLHVVNNHPPPDETAAWFATNTPPIT
jgi:death-on-curing protein